MGINISSYYSLYACLQHQYLSDTINIITIDTLFV